MSLLASSPLKDDSTFVASSAEPETENSKILHYYRNRRENQEGEQVEWLDRTETYRQNLEKKFDSQAELNKIKLQIAEFQKRLSDSHIQLYDEREQCLKIARENDDLKLQDLDNRQRIMELLALTEQNDNNSTYFKDIRPSRDGTGAPVGDLSIHGASRKVNEKKGGSFKKKVGNTTDKPKSSMKTIYMPSEQVNFLSMKVEQLKKQIQEEQTLANNHFEAMKEDRRVREEEMRLRAESDHDRIVELAAKAERLESLNQEINKKYLAKRLIVQKEKQRIEDENELLKIKNKTLAEQLDRAHDRAQEKISEAEKVADIKFEEYAEKFRKQASGKENRLRETQAEIKKAQTSFRGKMYGTADQVNGLADRYERLEGQRSMEVEGFQYDILRLKKKLKGYEEYIFKLQQLVDHPERLHEEVNSETVAQLSSIGDELNFLDNKVARAKQQYKKPFKP